jgi:anaphase-promoting complex subunit 1
MLRVIARALILWDEVEPTREWVEAQLPGAVHLAHEEMRELAESMSREEIKPAARHNATEYDRQAVRLIYTHVIAAACFSIGLRFAGTGDKDAASAIYERVEELLELRDASSPSSAALRPPSPVLEMCLGCASISLSMVLAGTGDLDALRLLKILRWPCTVEINYGSHLAFGTAIGLLFLGGGTCTLGRDPQDIAALIMAFFPRFPSSTADNQYHLQALRNLYALAVKHREIRAVDVSTGESVFVPIEVHFHSKAATARSLTTPCLLLNTDMKPCELRVVSKEYFPQTVNLDGFDGTKVIFVKRRSSDSWSEHDPPSQGSSQNNLLQRKYPMHEIRAFTTDPLILSFAKHFCDDSPTTSRKGTTGPFTLSEFFRRVLHECFMTDKQEALPLYITLRSAISSSWHGGSCPPVTTAWDFRLIRSFCEARPKDGSVNTVPSGSTSKRLLNCELVAYLIELLESKLTSMDTISPSFASIFYNIGPSSCIEDPRGAEDVFKMDLS